MAIQAIGPGGIGSLGTVLRPGAPGAAPATSFSQVAQRLLGEANAQQLQADQAVQNLAMGKTENVHDVMLAMAKADLSFRLVMEIRNRLTEAYQEIMRMQV